MTVSNVSAALTVKSADSRFRLGGAVTDYHPSAVCGFTSLFLCVVVSTYYFLQRVCSQRAADAEEVRRAEQEQADVVSVDAGWPAERWDCVHPP